MGQFEDKTERLDGLLCVCLIKPGANWKNISINFWKLALSIFAELAYEGFMTKI